MPTDRRTDNEVGERIAQEAAAVAMRIIQETNAHPVSALFGMSAALASMTLSFAQPGKEAAAMVGSIHRLTRDTMALLGDNNVMNQKAMDDAEELLEQARRAAKGGRHG